VHVTSPGLIVFELARPDIETGIPTSLLMTTNERVTERTLIMSYEYMARAKLL
jgi:hypothetical protein